MNPQEEWRRNGFRLQLISRWVLPRLGFKVMKGQEDKLAAEQSQRHRKLSPYFIDYADYLVSRNGRLFVVEVKAPVSMKLRHARRRFGSMRIQFSRREWQEYCANPERVKILLWEYNGFKPLLEQKEPIRYALFDFKALSLIQDLPSCVYLSAEKLSLRPRQLMPQTVCALLHRACAMEVVGIEPRRIVYET